MERWTERVVATPYRMYRPDAADARCGGIGNRKAGSGQVVQMMVGMCGDAAHVKFFQGSNI